MNCNKCGTPIIPGENTCRFCGTSNNFSKREEKHEIIGFDDIDLLDNNIQEAEIIDFMIGEDEVSFNDDDTPVMIDDLIIDSPVKEEEKEEEPVEEKVVNSVIEEPPTARIPVEDVVKTIEEETEEVVLEPSVNLDATTSLEKIDDKKSNKKKDDDNKKKGGSFLTVLLLVLLIASLIVNYFLFTGKDNIVKPSKQDNTVKTTLSSFIYGEYETKLPSNWTVNTSNKDYALLSDEKLQWQASLALNTEIDYAKVSEKTSQITDALGLQNYLITSDYNKTTNNKEFYIFKGKYYEYAVYVIVTPIDDDTTAIVDLKFTGEVNEDILNNILDLLSNTKKANLAPIKENFEFKNLVPQFKNIILKES